jgi:hypothetical protein
MPCVLADPKLIIPIRETQSIMDGPKAKTIQLLHPEGKKNFKISEEKYNAIKSSIIRCLKSKGELTHAQLLGCVSNSLASGFDGSISWYVEAVKLDLEARGVLKRTLKSRQQFLALSTL